MLKEVSRREKGVRGAVFLRETLGESLFPCLLQLLEAAMFLGSWPLFHFKASNHIPPTPASGVTNSSVAHALVSFSCKDPGDYAGPPGMIQDNPSQLKILNEITSMCKVPFAVSRNIFTGSRD